VLNPVKPAVEHPAAPDLSGWGPGGRRFKSGLPDYESPGNRLVSSRFGSAGENALGVEFHRGSSRIAAARRLDVSLLSFVRLTAGSRCTRKSGSDPSGRDRLGGVIAVMGAPGAKHTVLDELASPIGVWGRGGTSPWGIQSRMVRGGNPERADLSDRAVCQTSAIRPAPARPPRTAEGAPELEPFQEDTTHEHT
jgi:hypothetical protein